MAVNKGDLKLPPVDLKVTFDGKPPKEFVRAQELLLQKVYKPNKELRQLLLTPISDFISGDTVRAKGYEWLNPFKGFLGDPGKARNQQLGYANPSSAPDITAKVSELRNFLPKNVVDSLVAGQAERGVNVGEGLVTIELKQAIATNKSAESITQQSPGADVVGDLRKRVEDATRKARGKPQNKPVLQDWFVNKADDAYRLQVGRVINQKITNLLFLTRVDGKASFSIVPEAAKRLGVFSKTGALVNATKFKQYFDPQFTSSKGNSIVFKLNTAGMRFLESIAQDITNEMLNSINRNLPTQLINYFIKGPGKGSLAKFIGTKPDGLTQAFAEILLVASEFDPKTGGKPFKAEMQLTTAVMGDVVSKFDTSKIGDDKKKQKSIVQDAVSTVQLTEIARRAFVQRMPKDRGQPPVPNILTYRTGRFAQSFQITKINEAARQITYTYDPIYRVAHENTSRDPRTLIQVGIRQAVQQVLQTSQNFKMVRK